MSTEPGGHLHYGTAAEVAGASPMELVEGRVSRVRGNEGATMGCDIGAGPTDRLREFRPFLAKLFVCLDAAFLVGRENRRRQRDTGK